MSAKEKYFDALQNFVEVTVTKWQTEINKLEEFIYLQKAENKNTLYLEIRLKNQINYLQSIENLTMLAAQAIYEYPTLQAASSTKKNDASDNTTRKLIADMPAYSDSFYLEKIYQILINSDKI